MYDEEVEDQALKTEAEKAEQVLALNPPFFELLIWRSDKDGDEDWQRGTYGLWQWPKKTFPFFS